MRFPSEQGVKAAESARWPDPAVARVRARGRQGQGVIRAIGPGRAGAIATDGPAAVDSVARLAWSRRRSCALGLRHHLRSPYGKMTR